MDSTEAIDITWRVVRLALRTDSTPLRPAEREAATQLGAFVEQLCRAACETDALREEIRRLQSERDGAISRMIEHADDCVRDERETCAKVAESFVGPDAAATAHPIAAAIRARK
jgi:hypothetical protein